MNSISKTIRLSLLPWLLFLGVGTSIESSAQNSEDLLFAVGTSATTYDGEWAYLMWQSTEPLNLQNRVFEIYAKPGFSDSSADYHRRSVVQLQEDPLTIAHLIQIGTPITEEAEKLEETVDQLFKDFIPNGESVTIGDKLSAILRGAMLDDEKYADLNFLARRFPAVAMSMGVAYACPLSEITTFEIRESLSGNTRVIGRVTVEPGNPVVLPAPAEAGGSAPAGPANVSLDDGRGDLNVRLRWSVPESLRRLSLLQFGYNVWRVTPNHADKRGWIDNPPTAADLISDLSTHPSFVKRINNLPILIDYLLTPEEAHDILYEPVPDTETFFVQDNNDRFSPGGVPFEDGDTFYYYVSARDILGRDGEVSMGTRVSVCRTIAPPAPMRIAVVNRDEYSSGESEKFFEISWKQNENIPAEDLNGNGILDPGEDRNENGILDAAIITTGYKIYRWDDANQYMSEEFHDASSSDLAEHYVGEVAHLPGETYNSISDIHEAFSPIVSSSVAGSGSELGKPYWFTVRAVYQGACNPVVSGDSAPVYGVLRDRQGPDAPNGWIETICHEIYLGWDENGVKVVERENVGLESGVYDPNYVDFQVRVSRNTGVDWVDYKVSGDPYLSRRIHFPTGSAFVIFDFKLYVGDGVPDDVSLTLVAGNNRGVTSDPLSYSLDSLLKENISRTVSRAVLAEAVANFQTLRRQPYDPEKDNCTTHFPIPPLPWPPFELPIDPVLIFAEVPDDAEEIRFYRRVNDSELQLIFQYLPETGEVLVSHEDYSLPISGARICYFAQAFDKHGNGGQMAFLSCIESAPRIDLPTPQLSTPESIEEDGGSTIAELRWYCPPENVSRFKVLVGHVSASETSISDSISAHLVPVSPAEIRNYIVEDTVNFKSYLTGVVGGNFGFGQAAATAELDGGSLNFNVLQGGAGYFYPPQATLVGSAAEGKNYTLDVAIEENPDDPDFGTVKSITISGGATFSAEPVVEIDAAPSSPEFNLRVKVEPDTKYYFAVQALGVDGAAGTTSNVETFIWTPVPEVPYEGVPWPARDLPIIRSSDKFHPKLKVEWVETNTTGHYSPGVRIGEIYFPDGDAPGTIDELGHAPIPTSDSGAHGFIYHQRAGLKNLLPFALYRYQVADEDRFPSVSGDVYQVTPLMEEVLIAEAYKNQWVIVDPYITVKELDSRTHYSLYMMDPRPVLKTATYQYLLVRFGDNGEILEVLKLPEFTAPSSPEV